VQTTKRGYWGGGLLFFLLLRGGKQKGQRKKCNNTWGKSSLWWLARALWQARVRGYAGKRVVWVGQGKRKSCQTVRKKLMTTSGGGVASKKTITRKNHHSTVMEVYNIRGAKGGCVCGEVRQQGGQGG